MNKIGDKSGSIGWGRNPAQSKSASPSQGDQAFKRALDAGNKPGQSGVQERQKAPAHPSGNFASANITSTKTAVYETTQVLSCAEFVHRFPETKQSLKPIVDLNQHKQLPTIALVSCSHGQEKGSVERIGNTIFISRNAENAAEQVHFDDTLLNTLVGAIGQCIGSN